MNRVPLTFLIGGCSSCASTGGSGQAQLTPTPDPQVAEQNAAPTPVDPVVTAPSDQAAPTAATSEDELRRDCNVDSPEACAKLCDRSDPRACYVAGLGYQKGPPDTRDDGRSLALYQRGCDLGSMEACGNLGLMFEKGRGTSADPQRARALYEKVCDAGVPVHCRNVGRLCEGNAGFPSDSACASEAYTRALRIALDQCSAGTAEGCAVAGHLYRDGKGTPPDEDRARTLLSKACAGGYRWACATDPHP
jgi:TPR repeat protein